MTLLLQPNAEGIAHAAELLRAGKLVAFPTETVYGLGVDATNDAAAGRLYEAKGRPGHNPLIVHVPDADAARRWAAAWPETAQRLAERFWPGPLTLVVPARPELSRRVLAGGETVGLRAPDQPAAQELLRACGLPIAAPSANRSGRVSPVEARHVLDDLGGRIAAVLDGGPCRGGIESTVLDLCGEKPRILRPGLIGRAELEATIGGALALQGATDSGALRSPGLLERHYAPQAPLRLLRREEMAEAPSDVARIFLGEGPEGRVRGNPSHATLPADPSGFAATLYTTLREMERRGPREIWLERPPEAPEWEAIHDRLKRAAS